MNASYGQFQQSEIGKLILSIDVDMQICKVISTNACNKTDVFVLREFLFLAWLWATLHKPLHVLSVWPLQPYAGPKLPASDFFTLQSPRQCWLCVGSELPRVYHSSGELPRSPLTPAPLPGPRRNSPGLVIAFVGAIEFYGWLKLPNLTVCWTLNGAQRGAALQTAAAAKFLQWRPAITPTQTPIQAAGEVMGGGKVWGLGVWL